MTVGFAGSILPLGTIFLRYQTHPTLRVLPDTELPNADTGS